MNTNRRQLRAVPDTLAFIQLDHDDGGKVLNLSEGGLSFEAFAPVPHRRGPIRFWFSAQARAIRFGTGSVKASNAKPSLRRTPAPRPLRLRHLLSQRSWFHWSGITLPLVGNLFAASFWGFWSLLQWPYRLPSIPAATNNSLPKHQQLQDKRRCQIQDLKLGCQFRYPCPARGAAPAPLRRGKHGV